jgi:DNA-binding transcriptional ArsR family regulator
MNLIEALREKVKLRIEQYEIQAHSESILKAFVDEIMADVESLLAAHPVGLSEEQVREVLWASSDYKGWVFSLEFITSITKALNAFLAQPAPTQPIDPFSESPSSGTITNGTGFCRSIRPLTSRLAAPASDVDLVRGYMTQCGYTGFERPDAHHHFQVALQLVAKVRADALKEAAQVEYYDRECGGMMPLPKAARDAIRALVGPSGGGKT